MKIEGKWEETKTDVKNDYISFEIPYSESIRRSLHKHNLLLDFGLHEMQKEKDALLRQGSDDYSMFVCIEVDDVGWKPVAAVGVLHTKEDFAIEYPDFSNDIYCRGEILESLKKAVTDKFPDRTPMEVDGHSLDMDFYKGLLTDNYNQADYNVAFRQTQIIYDIVCGLNKEEPVIEGEDISYE